MLSEYGEEEGGVVFGIIFGTKGKCGVQLVIDVHQQDSRYDLENSYGIWGEIIYSWHQSKLLKECKYEYTSL